MCGLSGILLAEPVEQDLLRARLRNMVAALSHRGPDDEGVWSDCQIGLAHARLAIVDRSRAGHQPMSDDDEHVWLVFNGEIYNFRTLRAELEQHGHRFRSQTDSEVILYGYKHWGRGVLARLRGMFAFALWDGRARRLLLGRDRLGKKPLFYAQTSAGLIFASEIKAILRWPGVARSADLAAIHHYLSLQYVPHPHTAFEGIRSLSPAHALEVESSGLGESLTPRTYRYWSLPDPRNAVHRTVGPELLEETIHKLEEAVRLRMTADVPVGVFLSGGVDSSAVVAMMARAGAGRIKTFSIGFEEPSYDEAAYARLVARRYASEHYELTLRPDAARVLPQLVWHYNQPFADSSAVPTFHLAQLARKHVTVALTGDGGDEGFLGYERYSLMRTLGRVDRHVPRWIRRAAGAAIGRLPVPRSYARRRRTVRSLLGGESTLAVRLYESQITYFTDEDKRDGYGPALRERLHQSSLDLLTPYFDQAPDLVTGANWADLHTYLPDDLMTKVDVATMAHGLEARAPLLDHEFLEWATGFTVGTRMAHGVPKYLFKKALEPYLPHAVLYRAKMGFAAPVDQWLRSDLKPMASDLLLSRTFAERGLFDPAYVEQLLDSHCDGTANHSARLWALIMLEAWFRMWIDPPVLTV